MKRSGIHFYIFAGAIVTCPIPLFFGVGVAKLFGVWLGIGAGILSWLFATTIMALFWLFSNRAATRARLGTGSNAKVRVKTSWAKGEYHRLHGGPEFTASVNALHHSIEARHAGEFATAGIFRRLLLRYGIAAEFQKEMTKEVEVEL